MNVKNKKSVLYAIIILLVITLPMGIIGLVLNLKQDTPEEPAKTSPVAENLNHEFLYEGSLYFYDGEELLGTYPCENSTGVCDYATATYDDENYPILSYKEEEQSKLPIISKRYVFLIDAPSSEEAKEIILYDLQNNKRVAKYSAAKNYGIGIENNYFIVKNISNQWGVITLNESGSEVSIPFEYDFIGLIDDKKDSLLAAEKFVVAKDNLWSLIGTKDSVFASDFKEMIVTYNGKHIITKVDDLYYAKTYEGTNIFQAGCKSLTFTGRFFNIIDQNNQFYVYDSDAAQIISQNYQVNATDEMTSEINGQKLEIILNGTIIETITI